MASRTPAENAAAVLPTFFAPAARADVEQVDNMAQWCLDDPVISVVLESVDGFVLILNKERQVVAANPEIMTELEIVEPSFVTGLRPGELFSCVHCRDNPGGCGTSKHCSSCGAAVTLLASQTGKGPVTGECLMTVRYNGVLEGREFRVRATPFTLAGEPVTIFTLHDISAWKRRELMERIFLHDALNIVTSLQNWGEMLHGHEEHTSSLAARKIVDLSRMLNEEVQQQRLLLQAEDGELEVASEVVTVTDVFSELRTIFGASRLDGKSRLVTIEPEHQHYLCTDYRLLIRILVNMIKNALEATEPDGTVPLLFDVDAGHPSFTVKNDGVIPPDVQLRIFQRSFSTKSARGRGIGTYSMKLLGERYMGGRVSFTSTEMEGTRFTFRLPAETLIPARVP